MSRAGRQCPPIGDELGDAANVLLHAPTMDPVGEEGCGCLLDVAPPEETAFLSVSLSHGPDAVLDTWRSQVSDELPARSGFVAGGDQMRSATAPDGGTRALGPNGNLRVEAVSSPADLTGIGMKMGVLLEELAAGDEQVVVCFRSLTTLLQYVDLEKAFRFLHVITGRLSEVDAMAHFHLDPDVHDERERNTLVTLFDALMAPEGDDGWTLRTR